MLHSILKTLKIRNEITFSKAYTVYPHVMHGCYSGKGRQDKDFTSVGLIVVFSLINYAITGYGNSLWLGGCLKLIILFSCPSEYLPVSINSSSNVQKKLRINFDLIYMHVHFSSPKPKAQVSFSEQNLSVVCRRKLSQFHVLLQNHGADFNEVKGQTKGLAPFKGDINLNYWLLKTWMYF